MRRSLNGCAAVVEVLAAPIARIDREQADLATAGEEPGPPLPLLTRIPGLGLMTAATLLASLPIERLTGPRQLAADDGLCAQQRSSGTSVRGRSGLGPSGPAHLRKALDMPALAAMRANPCGGYFAHPRRFVRAPFV